MVHALPIYKGSSRDQRTHVRWRCNGRLHDSMRYTNRIVTASHVRLQADDRDMPQASRLASVAPLHGPGRQPSHASAGQPDRREGEDQLAPRSHLAPCGRRRSALLARCGFRRRQHHRLAGTHGRRGSLGAGAGAGVEWRGGEHGQGLQLESLRGVRRHASRGQAPSCTCT